MTYTGIRQVTIVKGMTTHVQVRDPFGNELPLPLDDYIERGVQPDWRSLPRDEPSSSMTSSA